MFMLYLQAPEALRDGTYSAKTDVWSFGVVMFEVIAQSEPHVEEDPLFIGIKIRDGAMFPRLPATSTNDEELRNLMEQCCRKDPNERPVSITWYIMYNYCSN